MIAKVSGTVIVRDVGHLVIETGGVGYRIAIGLDSLVGVKEGDPASLWTHLAIREDSHELYGFETKEELDFFSELIKISGIGPKSAQGILSVAPLQTLREAIGQGNLAYLTKISGIGKKTAEKIILELREKIADDGSSGPTLAADVDALEALKALGFGPNEARAALREVPSGADSTSARVHAALKILGSRHS